MDDNFYKILNKVIKMAFDEWQESEHPRDDDGKFTDGAGNSNSEKSKNSKSKLDIAGIKKRLIKELSSEALSKRLSSGGKAGSGYLESGGESVNAEIARSQGLGTAKDIVRELKKEGYDVKETDLRDFIEPSEWHHTGKSMAKTDFYDIEDIDEEALNKISEYNKKRHNFDKLKTEAWAKYKNLSEKDLLERYKEATGDYWIPDSFKKKERQDWIKNSILFDDFKKNTASKVNKMSDDELFEISSIGDKDFFAKKSREDKVNEALTSAFHYKPDYYVKLLSD